MAVQLTGDQLKRIEIQLKRFLPRSQQVYGCLVLINRVRSDPVRIFVDKWPEFSVVVCKPECKERGDLFKDTLVFANDEAILEGTMRESSIIDWTQGFCIGINRRHMEVFKALASEKDVPYREVDVCHMMTLQDVSSLPSIDSSGISLGSLDESHTDLVNQTWKFGKDEIAVRMIQNMLKHFPSCCVLDAEGKPVSWILTYSSCSMGVLYTLPEHRGKGYAKVVISTLAKKLHAEGYPTFCFIEEENEVSYRLFKSLGFTEDSSYRETWFKFNGL
ncbi:glycine N-acyltransferase-like protein 3 [Plectropomus leopardus]|uniref:glycine N-acyltransferase-like protein 3 n=1 Tax=Plectropomus leopardus TaxID=160734 RepID=UPI001C4CDC9F|nr:glycine N-acyltransferase-like protein 3 [Plectropomus leopardus]